MAGFSLATKHPPFPQKSSLCCRIWKCRRSSGPELLVAGVRPDRVSCPVLCRYAGLSVLRGGSRCGSRYQARASINTTSIRTSLTDVGTELRFPSPVPSGVSGNRRQQTRAWGWRGDILEQVQKNRPGKPPRPGRERTGQTGLRKGYEQRQRGIYIYVILYFQCFLFILIHY